MQPISTLTLSAAAIMLWAASASAQNAKSFVSITGNDSNTCATDTAPCRSLAGALNKTDAGGAIYCLNGGDFASGTLTITKSIAIDCASTGGLLRVDAIAVLIQAAATDVVHIRGLKISSSDVVISLSTAANVGSLRIEDCDIVSRGTALPAVELGGSTGANVFEALFVNTTITGGGSGILIQPDGGGAKVTLDRVRVFNGGIGIDIVGTNATTAPNLRMAITDSTISGNTSQGLRAASTNGLTRVFIKNSLVAENGTGLQANGSKAVIHVEGSAIAHNGTGLSAINGGKLVSFGNNALVASITANGAFTATATLK